MAVSYSNVTHPGLLAPQYPPPLLPKPGKENVRLQKLLKKSAKKKAAPQPIQAPAPFRSSLSPVNEASPDLEHSDHSTPPKTPESPFYGASQPSRFNVRPLYQHVPSPYPRHRGSTYGRTARFSPQPYVAPPHAYPQHVAPLYSYTPPPRLVRVSPVGVEVTVLAPSPVPETVTHAVLKPITVITPLMKPRSPRPMFKATGPSKSPKPMFDVPQIKMYTANTYEMIKTPLYDSTGLTFIGGTLPQSKTPTSEIKIDVTPTSEVKRGLTPTSENKRSVTPTSEGKRGLTLTSENKRSITPTSEVKRGLTPTSEIKTSIAPLSEVKRGLTPTSEIKRSSTPTSEVKRGLTPTSEIKRSSTPTSDVKRGLTPTLEKKRSVTPTSDVKRGLTPTSEIKRSLTPTYESSVSRTSLGRPKTPSYHVTRPKTPVFEVSRPNPLLFAVSPITTEAQRSKTPTFENQNLALPNGQNVSTPNGEIHLDVTSNGNVSQPEPPRQEAPVVESTTPIPTAQLGYQRPKTPTYGAPTPTATSYGNQHPKTSPETPKPMAPTYDYQYPLYVTPKPTATTTGTQRPKTPTYEPPKSPAHSLGYQRPKTPVYESPQRGVSPLRWQRPKTPTSVAPKTKSTYYGLTPAEYVAYGGIQSHAPSFGFSRPKTPTQGESKTATQEAEESKAPTQELSVKTNLGEVFTVETTHKEDETPLKESAVSTPAMVLPTIVVSQALDVTAESSDKPQTSQADVKMMSQEPQIEEKPKVQTVSQDIPKVKTQPSKKPEVKTPEKEKVKTIQEAPKLKTCTPEAKHVVPAPATKPDSNRAPLVEDGKQTAQKLEGVVTKTSKTKDAESPTLTPIANDLVIGKPVAVVQTPAKRKEVDDQVKLGEDVSAPSAQSASEEKRENLPAAEPILKVIQKPKGMKSKLSGWSRLKKHMVVEVEEPKFPDSEKEATKEAGQEQSKTNEDGKTTLKVSEKSTEDGEKSKAPPKATKMWDAVLFQMFSTKENIMQQIEANKSEEEKKEEKNAPKEVPAFAHRLPVLLFSPRFDAKRLKEAASRPLTKISTVFEMGLIGRKNKDEEPKDFNRTARGFAAS